MSDAYGSIAWLSHSRENGNLTHLTEFAKVQDSYFSRSQPRQKVTNMMALLDTFIILTITPAAHSGSMQVDFRWECVSELKLLFLSHTGLPCGVVHP